VLVAADDGPGLLGWAAVEPRISLESGAVAELAGLVVDGRARRRGVGARLLAAAEDWARGQGLEELVVRSSTRGPESHSFHAGQGYQAHKTQQVYRKPLPAPG